MGLWSYEGKRVVVAGCFSGMGEAVAGVLVGLGAEVHGVDVKDSPVKMASFRRCDLRDPESIDAAVKSIGGPVDALFNCAGLPQTFPARDVLKVNFIGMRHWTERWIPLIKNGGAIASIASSAAYNYQRRLPTTLDFVTTRDFSSAVKWAESNAEAVADGYVFSKEALVVWTQIMGMKLVKQGIRINCTCPGPTSTPMMPDFEKIVPVKVLDVYAEPIGRRSTADEQAYPMIFLNSGAASYVNGHVFNVDGGFIGGVTTKQLDAVALFKKAMAS